MKKLTFLILVCLFIGGKASGQVKILGYITTNGSASYPTHKDSLGHGGYRVVADITERDAITTERRKYGMMVYVQSNNTAYILRDATLGNANWVNFLSVTGTVSADQLSGTLTTALQPNITAVGRLSSLSVSGIIEAGSFSGTLSSSALNTITSLGNVQNLTVTNNIAAGGTISAGSFSGPLTGTLNTAAQPNITSVGRLTNLSVSGTIEGGTFSGTL
ncbi:MAG: hypothetical protein EPO58_12880, partial [Chitinophagaceae bacterium]